MSRVQFKDLLAEPVRNGVYKSKEFHGSGVRVVNMKELFAFDTLSDQPELRIELTPAELAKSALRDGDLLFARRSFVLAGAGKCSLVVNPSESLTFESSMIRARPNPERADSRFLFYYFKSPQGRARMASIAARTAVSGITGSNLSALEIDVPEVGAQRQIANVLRQFDELIETDQRRVAVLEEMARAIYREWFVKCRYPGHEDVPLIDSGLGPIPEGWKAGTIGDVLELKYGKALKADVRRGGDVAVVSSAGIVGWHDESFVDGPAIVVGRKGNVGSIHWVDGSCWPIDTAYYVATDLPLRFVVEQLRCTEFTNSHAAVPGLNREGAYARPFLIPPTDLLDAYQSVVDPLGVEASALAKRGLGLASLRDLLLPKLVTGKIDVSGLDLDALVEDSVV